MQSMTGGFFLVVLKPLCQLKLTSPLKKGSILHLEPFLKNTNYIIALISLFTFFHFPAFSQTTFNRYIYTHPNRKNDSQIKPSPLALPDNNSSTLEFSYKSVPTKGMAKKVKRVFGDCPEIVEKEENNDDDDYSSFFGNQNLEELYYGEQSTVLKELDEEANNSILKQQSNAEYELVKKQKLNIASYTASLKLRKKLKLEEELAKKSIEEKNETESSEKEASQDVSQIYEISVDSDGKTKFKSSSSPKETNKKELEPESEQNIDSPKSNVSINSAIISE